MERMAIIDGCFPHLRKSAFIERCKNFSDGCETRQNETLRCSFHRFHPE
jgi:hypothetical protein